MLRKVILASILLLVVIWLAACGGSSSSSPKPPSGTIKSKLISPVVADNTVSIPISEVERNWNSRFRLKTEVGETIFMAYQFDGKAYVRASVCPPCRSLSFSLKKDILICDSCATTFEAQTGKGIDGACVNFPKAAVPYETSDGNIVMKKADLLTAFQDTLKPGLP